MYKLFLHRSPDILLCSSCDNTLSSKHLCTSKSGFTGRYTGLRYSLPIPIQLASLTCADPATIQGKGATYSELYWFMVDN